MVLAVTSHAQWQRQIDFPKQQDFRQSFVAKTVVSVGAIEGELRIKIQAVALPKAGGIDGEKRWVLPRLSELVHVIEKKITKIYDDFVIEYITSRIHDRILNWLYFAAILTKILGMFRKKIK